MIALERYIVLTLEVDGALLVPVVSQEVSIGTHRHVALHMQGMVARVPGLHLKQDDRFQLEPELDPASSRITRHLGRQRGPRRRRRPGEVPDDQRRVLGRLEERVQDRTGRDHLVVVVDRAVDDVVIDADIPVGVAVRDVEGDRRVEEAGRRLGDGGGGEGGEMEAGAVGAEAEPEDEDDEAGEEKEEEENGAEAHDEPGLESLTDKVGLEPGPVGEGPGLGLGRILERSRHGRLFG